MVVWSQFRQAVADCKEVTGGWSRFLQVAEVFKDLMEGCALFDLAPEAFEVPMAEWSRFQAGQEVSKALMVAWFPFALVIGEFKGQTDAWCPLRQESELCQTRTGGCETSEQMSNNNALQPPHCRLSDLELQTLAIHPGKPINRMNRWTYGTPPVSTKSCALH